MLKHSAVVILVTFSTVFITVSSNVTKCYRCNSKSCGDSGDSLPASPVYCRDFYRSGKLVAVNSHYLTDVETLEQQQIDETHEKIFDIKRKIWEFFTGGEIDKNTEFVCIKATFNDGNGQILTMRDCAPKQTKSVTTACEFIQKKVLDSSKNPVYTCNTCNSDLCNSGTTLFTSFTVLIGSILFKSTFN